MKEATRPQDGFTLVEMMVGLLLLSIVALGFFQVLFAQSRAAQVTRSVSDVSARTRVALNRMVRDTREAAAVDAAAPASYTIKVDFNGDGAYENPNARGDHEVLTYSYDGASGTISLNGEVLVAGVSPISGKEIFTFSSNWLEYDWNDDGVTSWQEIDAASGSYGVVGVGNNDGVLNQAEFPFLSTVTFSLRVTEGERAADFTAASQLRNLV